jgi:hypothetical protein
MAKLNVWEAMEGPLGLESVTWSVKEKGDPVAVVGVPVIAAPTSPRPAGRDDPGATVQV